MCTAKTRQPPRRAYRSRLNRPLFDSRAGIKGDGNELDYVLQGLEYVEDISLYVCIGVHVMPFGFMCAIDALAVASRALRPFEHVSSRDCAPLTPSSSSQFSFGFVRC